MAETENNDMADIDGKWSQYRYETGLASCNETLAKMYREYEYPHVAANYASIAIAQIMYPIFVELKKLNGPNATEQT
jgi:hypothetical protein